MDVVAQWQSEESGENDEGQEDEGAEQKRGKSPKIKMFVGGRVTKFEALSVSEQNLLDLDILPRLSTMGEATVCRAQFGAGDEPGHHRLAISFGCTVALQTIRPPRHVVVVCDSTFKANWIRSNIHIQAEGGGVLTHTEFACGRACKGLFDSKLEYILSTEAELSKTLVIVQGDVTDVDKTMSVWRENRSGFMCLVLSSV